VRRSDTEGPGPAWSPGGISVALKPGPRTWNISVSDRTPRPDVELHVDDVVRRGPAAKRERPRFRRGRCSAAA
jgi:hypothetical protein